MRGTANALNLFQFLIDKGSRSLWKPKIALPEKMTIVASGRCTILPKGTPLSMIFSA